MELKRPTGALTPDWSANSFIMIIFEKCIYSEFPIQSRTKQVSQTTFIKLLMKHSELSALPVES